MGEVIKLESFKSTSGIRRVWKFGKSPDRGWVAKAKIIIDFDIIDLDNSSFKTVQLCPGDLILSTLKPHELVEPMSVANFSVCITSELYDPNQEFASYLA